MSAPQVSATEVATEVPRFGKLWERRLLAFDGPDLGHAVDTGDNTGLVYAELSFKKGERYDPRNIPRRLQGKHWGLW